MNRILVSLLILITILFSPVTAHAHLGGGPPFLKVDGKDAQTNPLNQGQTAITVPWDSSPDKYLVNKPVTFVIDVPELMKATTVPEEFAKDIKVRWSVATGDNFEMKEEGFEEGSSWKKTFTKPGSYLVIIDAKLPADTDFILIDTVQIDVVPNAEYKLPIASVYVGTQNDDVKKNVLFVSDGIFDDSTQAKKYLWDFGDSSLQEGKTVNRRMANVDNVGVESIYHRVIDENGFVADTGFVAQKVNEKLQFSSYVSNLPLKATIGTYEEASKITGDNKFKLSIPQFILTAVVILAAISGVWWFVLKKDKSKKKK